MTMVLSNRIIYFVALAFLISACTRLTPSVVNHFDVTDTAKYLESEELQKYWVLVKKPAPPKYPTRLLDDGRSGCVLIGFQINSDGRIAVIELLRDWPDWYKTAEFHLPAAKVIAGMVFEPTDENLERKPMWSLHVVSFQAARQIAVGGQCMP